MKAAILPEVVVLMVSSTSWAQATPQGANATLAVYASLRKALFAFDTAALPVSTLLGARLVLTFRSVGSESPMPRRAYYLFDVDRDFVESEATWAESAAVTAFAASAVNFLLAKTFQTRSRFLAATICYATLVFAVFVLTAVSIIVVAN